MEDLISIIVPVYNVEKYLPECIESIINQTYKNLDIILVDDGSPDNSGKICDKYAKKDNRIKVIHKKNGGVSSARNVGLDNAKGKWVSFVDSDDWIEKSFCEILLNKAIENNADVALSGYNRVTDKQVETIYIRDNVLSFNSDEYLVKSLNPQTGFGFCHMKLIKKAILNGNYFDENISVGEDALFNIMFSINISKVIVVKQALYNYRINNQSVVKRFDKNYANKYMTAMKKTKNYIFKNCNNKEIVQNYYNFVAFHVMLVAVNYCYHPENRENKKIKLLQNICEKKEFKEGIEKSNYNNISLTRKITLFTLKHKLFIITALICKIRQKQNKK